MFGINRIKFSNLNWDDDWQSLVGPMVVEAHTSTSLRCQDKYDRYLVGSEVKSQKHAERIIAILQERFSDHDFCGHSEIEGTMLDGWCILARRKSKRAPTEKDMMRLVPAFEKIHENVQSKYPEETDQLGCFTAVLLLVFAPLAIAILCCFRWRFTEL